MFFPGFGFGVPVGRFEQEYHVYPVSFIDKGQLENGDKVIMPPSALDRLASLHIDYPMLFEVQNVAAHRRTHCGVLEFVADEGCVYMPYWMMQNLLVEEGALVTMTNATLQKGTYVKLQPHTKDFLDISNPKAVLETTLRNFSCLTTGDNIMVAYNNKKYYIDIVETRPDPAISIIETDCEVDFAPPLDYVEPQPVQQPQSQQHQQQQQQQQQKQQQQQLRGGGSAAGGGASAGAGGGRRDGGASADGGSGSGADAPADDAGPSFLPFSGTGRRLDGKQSPAQAQDASRQGVSGAGTGAAAVANGAVAGQGGGRSVGAPGGAAAAPAGGAGGQQAKPGRLVFGGGGAAPASSKLAKKGKKAEEPKKEAEESKEEGPKFQAFSGKSYSLR